MTVYNLLMGYGGRIVVNVVVASDTQNLMLYDAAVATGGYVTGFTTVNLYINSGVYVGSSSRSSSALTVWRSGINAVPGFSGQDKVSIFNSGTIIGAGGQGGAPGSGGNGGTAGSPGGGALQLVWPTEITNNGTIAGGGGGGGSSKGGTKYNGCGRDTSSYGGTGGGGGAGYNPGAGGSGGSSGTRTAGGGGAAAGGGPGLQGGNSDNAGGAGGIYLDGTTYATWLVAGTRLGSTIN